MNLLTSLRLARLWSRRTSTTTIVALTTSVASLLVPAGGPAAAKATPGRPVTPTGATPASMAADLQSSLRPLREVTVRPIPAGDEIVVGRGDTNGWHLYAASAGGGWAWHPLATLRPGGGDPNGERWIGRQCLTGDGRHVVAVVAPWDANNDPIGVERGGLAYVVDAHTGAARPLVGGVSLHYFTPSCGAGGAVALTRYITPDEQTTQVVRADADTGRVTSVQTAGGELTGAVPAADGGVFAVRGDTIVHLANGRETVRARLAGQPFDLVAHARGGVDFLLGQGHKATVWQLADRGAHQVGTGRFDDLALFPGRGGHTLVVGVDHLATAAGLRALPSGGVSLVGASLDGGARATDATDTTDGAPTGVRYGGAAALPRTPLLLRLDDRHGGVVVRRWTPDVAALAAIALPPVLTATGAVAPRPPLPRGVARRGVAPRVSGTPPYVSPCAVPRNRLDLQVMQPSPAMVDWAANLAGRGALTAPRPANYANLGLPPYAPSGDFPLPAPFGAGGAPVPRLVLEAVFAQESNLNQASWHAIEGIAGNPLIANYYGIVPNGWIAGAQTTDCGYGLGQITSGMAVTDTAPFPYDVQRKVAVDYAENVAAAAQILAGKWKALADAGIVANDGNPAILESWYLAAWAYNSGLHPNTGAGPWGLGWLNNPANPAYPYNRHPFLHQIFVPGTVGQVTYDDASHPGDWPYQEKVFGWMEVPLLNPTTGRYAYNGTIMYAHDGINDQQPLAYELARPGRTDFCDPAKDQCDPTTVDGAGHPSATCSAAGSQCWWHYPASWCNPVTNVCHTGDWTVDPGTAEPAPPGDYYPSICAINTAQVPPGSTIVDSQPDPGLNLQGCTPATANWRRSGSFAFTYGDPATPAAQATDMDLHQLGTGLGGHIWFTHTGDPTDVNGVPYWGLTGAWTPGVAAGRYQIKVFIPSVGASSVATYTVNSGAVYTHTVAVNQAASTNAWVSLGSYWLGPGASLTLTNIGAAVPGDLAFSGAAFIPQPAGTYAMLGDSYSSGEGAGVYDLATTRIGTGGKNMGHRSPLSYNRVFAAGTTTFRSAATQVDVACSGAVVQDYYIGFRKGGKCANEDKQRLALNGGTSLVTLTFGGNDLDFAPIIKACVFHGFGWSKATCQSQYPNLEKKIRGLADPANSWGLPVLYKDILSDAPNAVVIVVGYPHLVRPGSDPNGGCSAGGKIVDTDRDWLNQMTDLLDGEIAAAAKQNGLAYISTSAGFDDHELCSASPWLKGSNDWTALLNGRDPAETIQEFFHPNAAGYAYEAQLVKAEIPVP